MQTLDLLNYDFRNESIPNIPPNNTIQLEQGQQLKDGVVKYGEYVFKTGEEIPLLKEAILHAHIWNAFTNNPFQQYIAQPIALDRDHKGVLQFVTRFSGTISMNKYLREHPEDTEKHVKKVLDVINAFQEKNIYHRDLHTENILIHENNIKIIDFGNALVGNMYATENENYPVKGHPSRDVGIFLRNVGFIVGPSNWSFLEKYDKIMRAYDRETRDLAHTTNMTAVSNIQPYLKESQEAALLHVYRRSPNSAMFLDYWLSVYDFVSLHPQNVLANLNGTSRNIHNM